MTTRDLHIRLPQDDADEFDELAKREDRSRSQLARLAIRSYLADRRSDLKAAS